MFHYTDTPYAPWTVVKSNDKKRARLEAMRHVLALFDYPNKDDELVGSPDNKIIGPPDLLSERKFTAPFPQL
jgi:polyphosphate kinase